VVSIVVRMVDKASKGFGSLFKGITRGIFSLNGAIAGITFGFLTKKLFEVGTSVEETGSKFRTVFGESADLLDEVAKRWGRFAGLTRRAARDAFAQVGAIGQSMGMAQRQSAAFAESAIRTAGDLASFHNKNIEDVILAMSSAFVGEREALKRLTVGFTEAELQAAVLNQTRKRSIKDVTAEEKALASLTIIQRKAGVANGDIERTQNSLLNRFRRLTADIGNQVEIIAIGLLPVFEQLVIIAQNNTGAINALGRAFVSGAGYAVNFIDNLRQIVSWVKLAAAEAHLALLQLDDFAGFEVTSERFEAAFDRIRAAKKNIEDVRRSIIHGEGNEPGSEGVFGNLLGLGKPGEGGGVGGGVREELDGIAERVGGILKLAEAQADVEHRRIDVLDRIGFRMEDIKSLHEEVLALIERRSELSDGELANLLEMRQALEDLRAGSAGQIGVTDPNLSPDRQFAPRRLGDVERTTEDVDLGLGGANFYRGLRLEEVAEAMGAFRELDELITGSLATSFSALGDAISGAMAAAVTGAQSAGQAFAQAMLAALSAVARAFGQFFLGRAIAAVGDALLGNPAGLAAAAKFTAAAAAMFAVAGLASAGAHGGSGGAYGGLSGAEFETSQRIEQSRGSATIVIEGGLLNMSDPRQADALARALGDLTGRRVSIVGG
jgi:hypothetical protein